ncbi:hypothetical protein HN385_04165 [archaeon]|jgi:hypothetical protein|nr:hypothetical protein [archaeon]MBT3451396.1 hypothetical protein [archaeon]MBT6869005.1 hypothetical protein [archaeon]MBT7193271.1 hypothetical protein [archaeon]MBT7380126.1 hypothetical protein [archaeon]
MSLEAKIKIRVEETNSELLSKAFLIFYKSYSILATSSKKDEIPIVAVSYAGTRYINGGGKKVIEICCPNRSKLHHISQRNSVFNLSHSGYIAGRRVVPKSSTYRKMPLIEFLTDDYLYKIYLGTYKLSAARSSRLKSKLEDIHNYNQNKNSPISF